MIRVIKVGFFTFVAAYLTAAFFVIVLHFTLPSSDLASGQSLVTTFRDPFVRLIATRVALAGGLIVFPVAVFCLKGAGWFHRGSITVFIVWGFIALVTPFAPGFAAFISPIVAITCLVIAGHSNDTDHKRETQ